MTKLLQYFLRDQRGATSVEYAVIASLLSIVILSAVSGVGSKLKSSYTATQAASTKPPERYVTPSRRHQRRFPIASSIRKTRSNPSISV